jgi:hypothetical protein
MDIKHQNLQVYLHGFFKLFVVHIPFSIHTIGSKSLRVFAANVRFAFHLVSLLDILFWIVNI